MIKLYNYIIKTFFHLYCIFYAIMASTATASTPAVSTDYNIKVDIQEFIEDINNKNQEVLVKLAEKVIESLTDTFYNLLKNKTKFL